MQHIRCLFLLMIAALFSASHCNAADLVLIDSGRPTSVAQRQIREAVQFYGLNLKIISGAALGSSAISKEIEEKDLVGVVIDAGALPRVDEQGFLRAMGHRSGGPIPVLILGTQQEFAPALLEAWSDGHVMGCAPSTITPDAKVEFGRIDGLTFQLWHVSASASSSGAACSFTFGNQGGVQPIEWIRKNDIRLPIFIRSAVGGEAVFLASEAAPANSAIARKDLVSSFLDIAPAMIFVRFCAGQGGWHAPHYYANFTIDDPWLREPYGFLNYAGLLSEMQEHHFHTTIAFIPWNFDRSEPQVVSLFKNHPAEYSIAVHGDNHDHKEFTDYRSKPLALQIEAIAQSLARMDEFERLTGIPYDRVMVFPHSIAPEQTLSALKSFNFLATVNSTNTPEGSVDSTAPADRLRPVTLLYDGFPSIQRYSTEVPLSPTWIAVNQFLQNPLFFYAHSDFFSNGIGAFDHLADGVNNSEPSTEWRGLAEIARHLYLIKTRPDGDFDVRAFSNEIRLENQASEAETFHLEKEEIGDQAIESVKVDGKAYPFSVRAGIMNLTVLISAGDASLISVKYVNRLQASSANPSHDSLVVDLLRRASDFRDIYLAKAPLGLAFIRFYTEHDFSPLELILCVVGTLIIIAIVAFFLRRILAQNLTKQKPHQTTAR